MVDSWCVTGWLSRAGDTVHQGTMKSRAGSMDGFSDGKTAVTMARGRGGVIPLTFRNADMVQLRLRDRSVRLSFSWRAVEANFENSVCVRKVT